MIKAVETVYKGYCFRSRLEARWAVFFDALGIQWEYEPEGLVLSDGDFYLPDFYLISFNCYFEVKRAGIKGTEEGERAVYKISDGMETDTWAGLIAFGDPVDDDLYLFCQETDDGGGGSYEGEVTIGLSPDSGKPHLFAYNDRRDRSFMTNFCDDDNYIPATTTEYGTYKYEDFVTQRVINARLRARQARFEHGQTPKIRRNRR